MLTPHEENDRKWQEQIDRRRGSRVPLSFPIEVSGFDRMGRMFREQAVTTDISEHGCRFDLLREMERGDVLTIQLTGRKGDRAATAKPLLFEVAWIEPSERGWTVGAMKLQIENIWHVTFPAKNRPSISSL